MAKKKRGRPKTKPEPKTVLVCKIVAEIPINGEDDFHLFHEVESVLQTLRGYGTADLEFETRSG